MADRSQPTIPKPGPPRKQVSTLAGELNVPVMELITYFFKLDGMWCPPDAFDEDDLAFLAESYGDAARLRASFADYEVVMGTRKLSAPEMIDRPVQHRTLILIGADQVTLGDHIEQRCAIAFPEAVGPFWVKGAGHFMPWEAAEMVNRAIASFCGDLLAA